MAPLEFLVGFFVAIVFSLGMRYERLLLMASLLMSLGCQEQLSTVSTEVVPPRATLEDDELVITVRLVALTEGVDQNLLSCQLQNVIEKKQNIELNLATGNNVFVKDIEKLAKECKPGSLYRMRVRMTPAADRSPYTFILVALL